MPEPITLLSYEALDLLVDTDPIRLRDEAYAMRAEVERLRAENATLHQSAHDRAGELDGARVAYLKVGNRKAAARAGFAADEIRALFKAEQEPGGDSRG